MEVGIWEMGKVKRTIKVKPGCTIAYALFKAGISPKNKDIRFNMKRVEPTDRIVDSYSESIITITESLYKGG